MPSSCVMSSLVAQRGERLVHRLHAELLLADLHRGVDLVDFVLADEVPDGRVGSIISMRERRWPLARGRSTCRRCPRDERELRADLGLLWAGKTSMMRLMVCAAEFVWSVENGGGRSRRGERRFDRLEVAQLADEDDIWVLAQGALERSAKLRCRRALRAG